MRGALILADAAQLITLLALVRAVTLAATWYSLLLAIVPALLLAIVPALLLAIAPALLLAIAPALLLAIAPALLLAIAPTLLPATAAFAPAAANLPLAVIAAVVLVVGIVTAITHTGAFFVPALVVSAMGVARLWRERG